VNADLHKRTGAKTLKSLQILRYIAATSVILVHIETIPNFGGFGVDIFFVLSGFVIALVVSSKQSPIQFAISRVSRIVPIYWLLTTLLLIMILLAPQLFPESTIINSNATNYLKSLFFVPYQDGLGIKPILAVGWSLNYEMLFYLLVWISLLFSKHPLILASSMLLTLHYISNLTTEMRVAGEFLGSQLI
jgi:exopolysaccharide production protein ExoZ